MAAPNAANNLETSLYFSSDQSRSSFNRNLALTESYFQQAWAKMKVIKLCSVSFLPALNKDFPIRVSYWICPRIIRKVSVINSKIPKIWIVTKTVFWVTKDSLYEVNKPIPINLSTCCTFTAVSDLYETFVCLDAFTIFKWVSLEAHYFHWTH